MFTDKLIWGLGSASQYSGMRVGLARVGMQQDWPPAILAEVGSGYMKVHYTMLPLFVNFCNFPFKEVESEWNVTETTPHPTRPSTPAPEKIFCECHYPIRIKMATYVNMPAYLPKRPA